MTVKETILRTLGGEFEGQCVYCGEVIWIDRPCEETDIVVAIVTNNGVSPLPFETRGAWNVCDADCAEAMVRILHSYTLHSDLGFHYAVARHVE